VDLKPKMQWLNRNIIERGIMPSISMEATLTAWSAKLIRTASPQQTDSFSCGVVVLALTESVCSESGVQSRPLHAIITTINPTLDPDPNPP
jgi:hypothetical protein